MPLNAQPEPARSHWTRWSTLAAVLCLVAGCSLALLPAASAVAMALRWGACALFLPMAFRRRSLLGFTFLAMLAGAELGADCPQIAIQLHFLAEIFLRLIRMIVAPLVFGGIVCGIAGHGKLGGVGRMAVKSLILFEVATTLGLILGAVAINLTQAGVGVALPLAVDAPANTAQPHTWQQILVNLFPENLAQAVAQNNILQVAVFAVLLGVAMATLDAEKRAPLLNVIQSLTDAIFRLTRLIMLTAPVAAGAALAATVGHMGLATLLPLLKLAVTCYGTLLLFLLVVDLPLLLICRIPVRGFVRAVAEPVALGFATTSSEAALPMAIERMEEFGVPRWITTFVIPTGYTFDMTGSSIYVSMAALFAAQAAGIHMSVGEQVVLLATLVLTSKGIAGVPRATLVVLLAAAGSFRIPAAAVLMLLGIDTLMDMGRSAMNVLGNCLASAVVARWEGELPTPPQSSTL